MALGAGSRKPLARGRVLQLSELVAHQFRLGAAARLVVLQREEGDHHQLACRRH